MFEVPYGQDPYSAIGKYIRENITIIEDIIAVIEINGVETNELFMVDMKEDGFFIWESDWYEGEEKVVLIDFFPVSEAINSSAQPNVLVGDTISRQAAIDALSNMMDTDGFRDGWAVSRANVDSMLRSLPSAQTEIIHCKDCKHYLYPLGCGHIDGMVTSHEDGFCSYAERREE